MSEGSSTDGNQTTTTDSNAGQNAASQSPATQSAPAQQAAPVQQAFKSEDLAALTTAISSLPETISRSVKEAIGTPKPPTSSASPQTDTAATGAGKGAAESAGHADKGNDSAASSGQGKPGKKTFTDWWFGK